ISSLVLAYAGDAPTARHRVSGSGKDKIVTVITPELDPRFSAPDATPTPWTTVREVLEAAELFWISTVRSDGRPHVTPLPAVWLSDAGYVARGAEVWKSVALRRQRDRTA